MNYEQRKRSRRVMPRIDRTGAKNQLVTATHCATCECELPQRRRVCIPGEGVLCMPCHAKRWGR